jgi:hypothetical protein
MIYTGHCAKVDFQKSSSIKLMSLMNQTKEKSPKQNVVFFSILFAACILGSIGIFIFAVGLETGNRIVNFTMTTLIENAAAILVLFGLFNAFVLGIYLKNKKKG